MLRELATRFAFSFGILPLLRTASLNGTGVDLKSCHAAAVLFVCGTVTDGTHTPKLQESDDNSTFTDVAASDQIGTLSAFTSSADDTTQKVSYVGSKRYIRPAITVTGSPSTGGTIAAVVMRQKNELPQS